jgi:hypothetical protein
VDDPKQCSSLFGFSISAYFRGEKWEGSWWCDLVHLSDQSANVCEIGIFHLTVRTEIVPYSNEFLSLTCWINVQDRIQKGKAGETEIWFKAEPDNAQIIEAKIKSLQFALIYFCCLLSLVSGRLPQLHLAGVVVRSASRITFRALLCIQITHSFGYRTTMSY